MATYGDQRKDEKLWRNTSAVKGSAVKPLKFHAVLSAAGGRSAIGQPSGGRTIGGRLKLKSKIRKDKSKMAESIFLAEPKAIQAYLEVVENATDQQRQAAIAAYGTGFDDEDGGYTVDGDTARFKVAGVLQKNESGLARLLGCESTSYVGIGRKCQGIKGRDDIKTVEIDFDTPGGRVDGCDEAGQAIADLAKHKTVIAKVSGMLCSAGYWLAAQASRIESSAPTNLIGSIGVVVAVTSWKEYDKKIGIKEIVIRSKNAPNKVPDADSKEGRDIIQGQIDAIERIFYQRIAAGRKVSVEEIAERFGRGDVFVSMDPDPDEPDAIKAGMIDAVLNMSGNDQQQTPTKEKRMLTKENIQKCVAVLQGDWPQAIKDMSGAVLAGTVEPGSLEIACATYQANKPAPEKKEDAVVGLVNDENDLAAQIASGRQRLGLGKAGV